MTSVGIFYPWSCSKRQIFFRQALPPGCFSLTELGAQVLGSSLDLVVCTFRWRRLRCQDIPLVLPAKERQIDAEITHQETVFTTSLPFL